MLRRVGVHGPFIPSVRQPTAAAANEPKPKYPRPNQQDSDDDDDDDADEDDATNENAQHASQDNVVDEREALFNSATDESELMSSVITTPETQIALVVSPVKTAGSLANSNTKKPTSDAVKVLPKPLVANAISPSLPSTTKRPAVVAKKVPVVPIQPPTQTQNNAPKVRTTKPLTKPLLNSVPTPSPTDSISTDATEPALSKKKPSTKVAGKKAAPKPTRPKDSVPPSPEKEERITMASYIRMQGGTPMKSAEEKKTTKDKATTDHAATTRRVAPVMPSVQHVASNPTYAPQLRVVDGKIVIDEQSLVVSTGPEQIEYEEGIVHESGLNITSASFTSRPSAERWTNTETERFYEGLRYWGTDFNLISKLFTNRNRRQIRNKYKREERYNLSKLNEALENRKKADEETIKLVSQRIASSQPPTTIINTITTTVEDDQSETSEGTAAAESME